MTDNIFSSVMHGEKTKRLLNYTIISIIFLLYSFSLAETSNRISSISVIITLFYFIVSDIKYNLPFLVGLSVYESVFKWGALSIWFILLLFYVVKLTIVNLNKNIDFRIFAVGFFLLVIELLGDLINVSIGQLFINLTIIITLTFFINYVNYIVCSRFDILFSLSVSFMSAMLYIVKSSGGFKEYINNFMNASSYALRFGHEYGETIGGAMAIPLYAALMIAFSVTLFLSGIKINIFEKIFSVFSLIVAVVFGSFTISRSFYLCIVVIVLMFFLAGAKAKYKIFILICVAAFLMVLYHNYYDIVNKIFNDLSLRVNNDSTMTGGRSEIWRSGLDYLSEHPIALLFGKGATRYQTMAAEKGYLFSAGMHNLVLDIVMSWGIVGLVLVVSLMTELFKKVSIKCGKLPLSRFIPLITYLTFSLTALRTVNMKTWTFLLATILFTKISDNGDLKNDT